MSVAVKGVLYSSCVRMKFILVIVISCFITFAVGAKLTKKSKDESSVLNKKLVGKAKPSSPAIIAIEIVDPNENKTKNSKRTIDSSLGYGYQNYFGSRPQPPKYEVYKYSQHDIPPYQGSNYNSFTNYDIQKSVSYKLPTQHQQIGTKYTNVVPSPNHSNYYQPGTTLFSTLNGQGQLGGLSSHLPQQYKDEPQVPVIILRIMPSQLADPTAVLYPNLPQSHPLASTLNSVNLQSLLNKYVQNTPSAAQQDYQSYQQPQQQEDEGYHYDPPNYQYVQQQQQQQQEITPQYQTYSHQQSPDSSNDLLTHENYPKNTHTRVVFRGTNNNYNTVAKPAKEIKTIQVTVPHSFSAVKVEMPGTQYSYSSQGSNNDNNNNYYYQSSAETGGDNQNYYYNNQPEVYENQGESQQVQYQQESGYGPNHVDEMDQYSYQEDERTKQRSKKSSFPQSRGVLSTKLLDKFGEST